MKSNNKSKTKFYSPTLDSSYVTNTDTKSHTVYEHRHHTTNRYLQHYSQVSTPTYVCYMSSYFQITAQIKGNHVCVPMYVHLSCLRIHGTHPHHTYLTLQLRSSSNKMFLAAISLCTKDFRDRQARPSTTCLQNWSSKLGRSGLDS